MSIVYITYNPQLKDFLNKKNIRFIICGLNPNPPHKTFWVYDRTKKEFNDAMDEWMNNK